MVRDANLVLDSARTLTGAATTNTTAIDTEGGFLAWIDALLGAMSGAGSTLDIYVQFSVDNGSNYYLAGKFQQLGPTNDSAHMRIPVYIPRPTSAAHKTKVRVHYVTADAGASYVVTSVYIEPMVSLAVPAIDELQQQGAVSLLAAT